MCFTPVNMSKCASVFVTLFLYSLDFVLLVLVVYLATIWRGQFSTGDFRKMIHELDPNKAHDDDNMISSLKISF